MSEMRKHPTCDTADARALARLSGEQHVLSAAGSS